MKAAIYVLAAYLSCSLTTELMAQSETATPGRFQVVAGAAETIMTSGKNSGSDKEPVVIKLDTATGQTWILARLFDGKTYREGWLSLGAYEGPKVTAQGP